MNYHYMYRITNLVLNKHYYGARSTKIDPKLDLGIKYFSSSTDKEFIQDQKLNNLNYRYKIISIFKNRKEAIDLEIRLHKKFNVGINKSFYNKAKQTSCGFDMSGTTHNRNPHTDESRQKISESQKGRIHSDEIRLKRSKSNIGKNLGKKRSEETKQKISGTQKGRIFTYEHKLKIAEANSGETHPNFGKKLSVETKQKISESRKDKIYIFNIETNKMKFINKDSFLKYEELGWVKGRKIK